MALETENNAKRTPRSKKEQKEGYHACKKADIATFGSRNNQLYIAIQ